MKKVYTLFSLVFSLLYIITACLFSPLSAQNPTPYNGTPPTFMTFDASYVKCQHGTGWANCNNNNTYWKNQTNNPNNPGWYTHQHSYQYNNAQNGVLNNGSNFSHRFITDHNQTDPCMCYQVAGNYVTNKCIPDEGWGGGIPIDTMIQIGGPNSQGTGSQSIEYWFIPDSMESVLLVNFSFAQEKANHPTWLNPYFYIEVLDQNHNLLDLGYYSDLNDNPMNNPNNCYYWPYSRFLIVPKNPDNNECSIPYCLATPTTYNYYNMQPNPFEPRECPYNQFSNHVPESHSGTDCEWFENKPIAFNLSKQAKNHETVIFRVKTHACQYSYHWAYGYFAAKMIPDFIQVDACGGDSIKLSVPYGFDENSYDWYAGADSASATLKPDFQGMHNLDFDLNNASTRVYPYYRCEMKSMTGVPFNYEANINFYDLVPNFTYEQVYGSCNYEIMLKDSSLIRTRKPAATAGGTEDTIVQNTQWIQWFSIIDGHRVRFATNELEPVLTFDNSVTADTPIEVMIVIEDSLHTCSDTIIKSIELDPAAVLAPTTNDTVSTCVENLPYIYDEATFGEQYLWNEAGTRQVIYPGAGWNGCDSTVNVTFIIQKPKAEIVTEDDFCDKFSATLDVETNVEISNYIWNTEETSPSIEVTTPGVYSVTITDKNDCTTDAEIIIPACKPFINLPNAITPTDHNGTNDYFYIPQKSLIQSLEFNLYNRAGQLIYNTTNKDFKWPDPDNGDKYIAPAVYQYILKIVDYNGISSMYKGSITVL